MKSPLFDVNLYNLFPECNALSWCSDLLFYSNTDRSPWGKNSYYVMICSWGIIQNDNFTSTSVVMQTEKAQCDIWLHIYMLTWIESYDLFLGHNSQHFAIRDKYYGKHYHNRIILTWIIRKIIIYISVVNICMIRGIQHMIYVLWTIG